MFKKRIKLGSLNSVHEPRNAEFTVLLGSFFAQWQSNDNNFGKFGMDKGKIIYYQ